jgi:chorismate-pyruvate lyase
MRLPLLAHPTAAELFHLFPNVDDRPEIQPIPSSDIPEPYRSLLVHTQHMTVTVEGFYSQAVDVRVLASSLSGSEYSRKILLQLRDTGEVVQFGIVLIDLNRVSDRVRREIVEEQTPLGRVLIQNGVMRHIEPAGYLKVEPNPGFCQLMGIEQPTTTYGRLGLIHTDGQPAIEVLEILAPILKPFIPSC